MRSIRTVSLARRPNETLTAVFESTFDDSVNLGSSVLAFIRVNPYVCSMSILKGHTMSKLIELIKAFIPGFLTEKDVEDKFLGEARDSGDLERRMHELDLRARDGSCGLIWGHRAW